jgi:hypothetical protein
MPDKALCPNRGTEGRRERESRREGRRKRFLRETFLRGRDGERHPGLRKGNTLRGVSFERRPWSVRAFGGYPPAKGIAPMTADVRRTPRRGTSSACATTHTHSTDARERISFEDASFTRSFDPGTSILTMHRGVSSGGEAADSASRLGKPTKVGRTNTGVDRTDVARLAACRSLPQGRGRDTSRKGRRSRSPSLRGSRAPVGLPARRSTLQKSIGDVGSQISSANALQKERPGSSERGSSAGRRPADETVDNRVERKDGASRAHR